MINVANKEFKINFPMEAVDETELALKEYYKSWRDSKPPFLALYNSFKDKHLRDLEAGPLKLYLFFAFAADNDYGHSWYSISSIAEFFNAQTRTIDNWIKVLVDKELIYREQKGKKSHTTYLIPYDNTLVQHKASKKRDEDNQQVLDDFIVKLRGREFLYGEVFKVFHLFQWGSNKSGQPDSNKSVQALFVITKRKNGVLIGHLYRLMKSDYLSVNELNIEELSLFDSPFKFMDENIIGLALQHDISIMSKSNILAFLKLMARLANMEDWQIREHQKVQYGEKDKFFPISDEADKKGNEEQLKQNGE